MERLDKDTMAALLEITATPAVTIYIPTNTTASPPHVSENQIRFKNLLRQAADELRAQDKHDEYDQLARELERLIDERYNDLSFWEMQTPGLLLCATPGDIRLLQLPIDTEEYVSVDDTFHLAPLIGLLNDSREFYLLLLAQQDPRLCKGDLYGLTESSIELPSSAREALNIDEPNQKSENQGTATAPSTNTGWFNGRGGARNPEEADKANYFRLIDKRIQDKGDRTLPLLVAGTEEDIADYRAVSKYPKILEGSIVGNRTGDDDRELFDKARTIIWKELILPDHKAAIEEYERIRGTNPDRASQDVKQISDAAQQGRVDKLLARLRRTTADTVQETMVDVPRITFPENGASREINAIARTVWQNSGIVYNLFADEMPNGTLVAARMRY